MWACYFPWAETIVGEDGLVANVQCKFCNNIERKPKLLAPKFNKFHKHVGCCKATLPNSNIVIKVYFYYKDVAHAKNEKTYPMWNSEFVMTLM
jgi:hypothetical protein